jgi:hypothetical protein
MIILHPLNLVLTLLTESKPKEIADAIGEVHAPPGPKGIWI